MKLYDCKICHTKNPKDFHTTYKSLCKKHKYEVYGKSRGVERTTAWNIKNPVKHRFMSARSSAKRRNHQFNITVDYLDLILKQQENRCAYTNLEFDNSNPMLSLSLDRIDSKKGYIFDNVQFVLSSVNYMKQDFTEEEFMNLCKIIYLNSLH